MVESLIQPGHNADSAELIEQISALENLRSATAAELAVAFRDRQIASDTRPGSSARRAHRSAVAQIALARRISPHQQAREQAFADLLVEDLPVTMNCLRRGKITEWAAKQVARELIVLDTSDRRRIDSDLSEVLPGCSAREAGAAAKRRVVALDAHAMVARMRRAVGSRRVSVRPAPDGMAYFTVLTGLKDAVSMYAALNSEALSFAREADDVRSHAQVMADQAFTRITGLADSTLVPIEIQLVMSDCTLIGNDSQAARLGNNVIPAPIARHLASVGADDDVMAWVRRLYADPVSGSLDDVDRTARRFSGKLRRFITLRHQICRTPYCEAPIRDIDHAIAWSKHGATDQHNGNGRCQGCNLSKESPGWSTTTEPARPGSPHRTIITTPTGHSYASNAPPVLERSQPRTLEQRFADIIWHEFQR
ncbi:MAG: DUF222 domain-containing protein [Antricoccus sp.]